MAMQLLERQNVYDPDLLMYRTALGMVRSASLNCYIFDVSASWCNTISTHHLCLITLLLFQMLMHSVCKGTASGTALQAEKSDTIETRMSLLQRQLGIGDACTFRLIEKNVTSLLPKSREQLKEDAKTSLNDLLRYHADTWTTLTKHVLRDCFRYEGRNATALYVMQVISTFG